MSNDIKEEKKLVLYREPSSASTSLIVHPPAPTPPKSDIFVYTARWDITIVRGAHMPLSNGWFLNTITGRVSRMGHVFGHSIQPILMQNVNESENKTE